jgi:hypothetical protein
MVNLPQAPGSPTRREPGKRKSEAPRRDVWPYCVQAQLLAAGEGCFALVWGGGTALKIELADLPRFCQARHRKRLGYQAHHTCDMIYVSRLQRYVDPRGELWVSASLQRPLPGPSPLFLCGTSSQRSDQRVSHSSLIVVQGRATSARPSIRWSLGTGDGGGSMPHADCFHACAPHFIG